MSPDQQDKRSVITIEGGDVDRWLSGGGDEVGQLLKAPAAELIAIG